MIKLPDSATALAGITAFLYSSSTAYTHGYFSILNLDSDVLDRNFHQIIYHGMILNIFPFFFASLFLAMAVTAHSIYVVGVVNYFNKSYENKRRIVKLRPLHEVPFFELV